MQNNTKNLCANVHFLYSPKNEKNCNIPPVISGLLNVGPLNNRHYEARKGLKYLLIHATIWMNFENIMLSSRNHHRVTLNYI